MVFLTKLQALVGTYYFVCVPASSFQNYSFGLQPIDLLLALNMLNLILFFFCDL